MNKRRHSRQRSIEAWAPLTLFLFFAVVGIALTIWSRDVSGPIAAWCETAAVAAAGFLAIKQLQIQTITLRGTLTSTKTDVFVKICELIDAPRFRQAYELITRETVVEMLGQPQVAIDGIWKPGASETLITNSAQEVLSQLEKIAIIVKHAIVNEEMVASYIGDVAVTVETVLENVIEHDQKLDRSMWAGVDELCTMCLKHGWTVENALRQSRVAL